MFAEMRNAISLHTKYHLITINIYSLLEVFQDALILHKIIAASPSTFVNAFRVQ